MMKLLLPLLVLISFKSLAGPQFEGIIEFVGSHRIENNLHTNELSEPTVELLSTIPVSKKWSATLSLLHEEEGKLEIDEAYISHSHNLFTLRAGKAILPLIKLETMLISDPLTLELFEQHTTMIESRFEFKNFCLSGAIFKGRGSNDKVKALLIAANYHNDWLEIGSSYISDITLTDFLSTMPMLKKTGAVSLTFGLIAKKIKLIFEGVAAVNYVLNDKRPTAYQIELSYTFPNISLISSLQGTRDINELAKTRFLTGIQIPINKNVTTAIEYSWDISQNSDKSQFISAQLVLALRRA